MFLFKAEGRTPSGTCQEPTSRVHRRAGECLCRLIEQIWWQQHFCVHQIMTVGYRLLTEACQSPREKFGMQPDVACAGETPATMVIICVNRTIGNQPKRPHAIEIASGSALVIAAT